MPTLNDQSSFLKMSLSSLMIIFVHFNFVAWSFPNSKECCDKVSLKLLKWSECQSKICHFGLYIYRKVLFYKPSRCPNTPIKRNLSALELVESGSSLSKPPLCCRPCWVDEEVLFLFVFVLFRVVWVDPWSQMICKLKYCFWGHTNMWVKVPLM